MLQKCQIIFARGVARRPLALAPLIQRMQRRRRVPKAQAQISIQPQQRADQTGRGDAIQQFRPGIAIACTCYDRQQYVLVQPAEVSGA